MATVATLHVYLDLNLVFIQGIKWIRIFFSYELIRIFTQKIPVRLCHDFIMKSVVRDLEWYSCLVLSNC